MLLTDSGMSRDVPIQQLLTSIRIDEWLREDVFQAKWWFLVGFFIFAALVWYKLVDKKRLPEIALVAGFTILATLILDEAGEELTLWDYPTDVFPIFPPLTDVNLASLPIIYSLIYQYFKTWKSFFTAAVIMAAVFAFVLEPLLVWGDIYQLLKWKHYYGFPLYVALALTIRWIVVHIYAAADKAKAT